MRPYNYSSSYKPDSQRETTRHSTSSIPHSRLILHPPGLPTLLVLVSLQLLTYNHRCSIQMYSTQLKLATITVHVPCLKSPICPLIPSLQEPFRVSCRQMQLKTHPSSPSRSFHEPHYSLPKVSSPHKKIRPLSYPVSQLLTITLD